MTKCKHIQKKLSCYQDGACNPAEFKKIETHLAQCNECRSVYADLENTWDLLRLPPAGSPGSFEASRIQAELKYRMTPKTHPWPARLGLAAGICAAILFGIVAGSHWSVVFGIKEMSLDEWANELQVQALNDIPQYSLSALYLDSQTSLNGGAR